MVTINIILIKINLHNLLSLVFNEKKVNLYPLWKQATVVFQDTSST